VHPGIIMAMPSFYKSFLLCYLSLLGFIQAVNNHGVTFLFPTAGQVLNYQDTINVTWTSPFPKPILYTFCYSATTNKQYQGKPSPFPHFIWTTENIQASLLTQNRGHTKCHALQRLPNRAAGLARCRKLQLQSQTEHHGRQWRQ
jgi:hypothetical protein